MKFLIILLLLTACGREKDSDTAAVSTPDISGAYRETVCSAPVLGWSVTYKQTNTATDSILDVSQYDANCKTLKITDRYTRTYVIGSQIADKTFQIDIKYTKAERIYADQASVDAANKDKGFGFSDWKINVAKDTTGLRYSSSYMYQPKNGEMSYIIFALDGSTYTGADMTTGDGTTPDRRPTKLATITMTKE